MAISGLFWTDMGFDHIGHLNNNLEQSILVSGLDSPQQIVPNANDNKIYFCDYRTIKRCDMDGSNVEELISTGNLPEPSAYPNFYGLAIDNDNGHMYFTDAYYDRVLMANLDGTNAQVLWSGSYGGGFGNQRYMAIDPINEYVYWDVYRGVGDGDYCIHRMNYNGSGHMIVAYWDSLRFYGLYLDVSGQKMYWANPLNGLIEASGIDGGTTEIVVSGLLLPTDVYVDVEYNKIYWCDITAKTISYANLDGEDINVLVSGINTVYSIFGRVQTIPNVFSNAINCIVIGSRFFTTFYTKQNWARRIREVF